MGKYWSKVTGHFGKGAHMSPPVRRENETANPRVPALTSRRTRRREESEHARQVLSVQVYLSTSMSNRRMFQLLVGGTTRNGSPLELKAIILLIRHSFRQSQRGEFSERA